MIGAHDFIGYYDWTFEYIRRLYGEDEVAKYWGESIALNSQRHAYVLIKSKGFEGLLEYYGVTLESEQAEYRLLQGPGYLHGDMYECPSLGFLNQRGQHEYHDYCQHCMGWINPLMRELGFLVDHEHNHHGQCWDEYRLADEAGTNASPPPIRDAKDVRLRPDWYQPVHHLWLAGERVDTFGDPPSVQDAARQQ